MTPETDGEQPVQIKVETPDLTEQDQAEETRWDPSKAATMADVLQQEGSLDRSLESRQDQIAEMQTPEAQAEAAERLQQAQDRKIVLDRHADDISGARERKANDDLIERLQGGAEGYAERSLNTINNRMKQEVQPYEALYDRNPEHFAAMPTSEFMGKVKELEKLREISANNERWSDYILNIAGDLTKALTDKQDIDFVTLERYAEYMARSIRGADSETADKILAVLEDTFSTSPESRLQQLHDFCRQVDELVQRQCDASEAAVDAFIAQETGTEQSEEEATEASPLEVTAEPAPEV